MDRRHLVGGGLLASVSSLLPASEAAAAPADDDGQVAEAVIGLRRVLERQFEAARAPSRVVAQIREQQRIFIRGSQKYPDFMEIGLHVWEALHDWHVSQLQPVPVTRTPDGRYTMLFMFTTLVLRPDLDPNYVGFGFDGERAPIR